MKANDIFSSILLASAYMVISIHAQPADRLLSENRETNHPITPLSTSPQKEPEINPTVIKILESDALEHHIRILSPHQDELVAFDDLVVSIDIFNLPKTIDKNRSKVLIDGKDLTEHTIITEDIILLVPSNINGYALPFGHRQIAVQFFEKDTIHSHTISWFFSISTQHLIENTPDSVFQYKLSFSGESRSESLRGSSQWYNHGNIAFDGELPWVHLRSNLFLTSLEKSSRQPQNRYTIVADTKWFKLAVGDIYPNLSPLIMNGRRLRGFSGSLESDSFCLEYVTGQAVRAVDGQELFRIPADTLSETGQMIVPPPNSQLVDTHYYAAFSHGIHKRTLTAIRPRFTRGNSLQVGLTYLHSKDDIGSIDLGIKPAQNLVIGSDIKWSFDNRRLEFIAQIAGSMLNNDIANGNLERDDLAELLGEEAFDDLEKVIKLSTLQKFITINQYLIPFDPLKGSSLAYDLGIRAKYAGHNVHIGYLRRGNDYHSFGLTALRKDIAGIHFRDRLRLMSNQLYMDLSLERLRDNLNDAKTFTTHFSNCNATVYYYPKRDLPSMTIGYGRMINDNRVDKLDAKSHMAILDITNRFFTQVSHIFPAFGIRHSGTFSLGSSRRNDKTQNNADVDIFSATSSVNSYFTEIPLQTSLGIGMYLSKIPVYLDQHTDSFKRSSLNFFNVILAGEYRLLSDALYINMSLIPTLMNYRQIAYQFGSRYMFAENISLLFQCNYLAKSRVRNDLIANFNIRYDL